jgi:hypothetical protein
MHENYSSVTFIDTECIVRRQNRARCRGRKRNEQNKKCFFLRTSAIRDTDFHNLYTTENHYFIQYIS